MDNDPLNSSDNDRLALVQRKMVIITLGLLIAFLATQVAIMFSDMLRILSISLFVCYTVVGLVDWLQQFLKSRFYAVIAVYAVLGVITVIGFIIVIPVLVYQLTQFLQSTFDQLPTAIEWFIGILTPLEKKLSLAHIQVKPSELIVNLAASAPKPDPGMIVAHISGVAMGTMTWFFYFLSILILAFYFLLDGSRMSNEIAELFPEPLKLRVLAFIHDADVSLHSFFKGQIVLGLLFGAVMFVVYTILGVPYALALGIVLGLWEIVPVVGPTIGFIPTVIAVLVSGMDHVPGTNRILQVIVVLAVFSVLQWMKDNIVAPKYIGNVIGLHPVVIFIAIMIGARVDGMLGIIVALPVACIINVFIKHVRTSGSDAAFAEGMSTDVDVTISESAATMPNAEAALATGLSSSTSLEAAHDGDNSEKEVSNASKETAG